MENERPEYLYCFIKWFKWANFSLAQLCSITSVQLTCVIAVA